MILLRLQGEKVVGVYNMTLDYTPKENEVLIERLPSIKLQEGEIAEMYWRNGYLEIKTIRREL